MSSETAVGDFGLIGLAVMGQNLILNAADHGFNVVAFNRTVAKVDRFLENEAKGKSIVGAHSIKEFCAKLKKPRRMMMLVMAGKPVDDFIELLLNEGGIEEGDIIIDGGNSHYPDTNRRTKYLASKGIRFVGTGVSGGEEGARYGPSIMPGGNAEAWPYIKDVLQGISAKSDGEACCQWVGDEGAGHYVKMVHNGIEYGDMQLICEAYDIMKRGLGLSNKEMGDIFAQWNKGVLDSFLVEITRDILYFNDEDGSPLLEKIMDSAGQKGTGKWTAINALDLGMPVTLIGESVFSRCLSSLKQERGRASKLLQGPTEIYFDGTARGQAKNQYEPGSNIINNWDVLEGALDYIFIKLGIDGSKGHVDRPVVITEPLANLQYSKRTMSEVLFELYGVPSASYGIDSLFSYAHNGGRTGLVVSSAYTSTHLLPVVDSKPLFAQATRLDWGRSQCADYLNKLLRAKYPALPGKINDTQIEDLVRQHCYISQDYQGEMANYLDWTGLEDRDVLVQLPFTEKEVVQKSEEELARAAEKRKESGRRLQEQAAKMRLDKLIRKEQELEYYKDLQQKLVTATKKDARTMLEADDFNDEAQLERKVKEMERSIRKQRNKDVGDIDEPEELPTYPLLDIPDEELDEEGIKQKRQQRLMKSNHDARARAKAEKEREKARVAEEERLDAERRETDTESWLQERRVARQNMIQRIKERDRLKADLGNRKSLASQMRMKNIANLASDNPKKRRRGGDDDTFGADDADWGIYRQIATGDQSDDEEEEDLGANLKNIEAQLLKYDPTFTEQSTQEAQQDWTKSVLHSFLRGPWPFDPESQRELNQIHLNVERIRVPEVIFQPGIAGIDQAGIVEIAEDIITQRLSGSSRRDDMLKDIFLTGGYTHFQGFEERLRNELRAVLPADIALGVRKAKDPILDAWRGAAEWAAKPTSRQSFVTRAEYHEKGADYIKEHNLGNAAF